MTSLLAGSFTTLAGGWAHRLAKLFASAREDLLVCSPYVGRAGIELLAKHATAPLRHDGRLRFLTDLSPANLCQASTDPAALLLSFDAAGCTSIRHLPRLHAKVYVADSTAAIITSANLTAGGLFRNYEYGVEILDPEAVGRIRDELLTYSDLGASISQAALVKLAEIADRLRSVEERVRVAPSSPLQREIKQALGEAEDELVRLRLAGGAMHTVFARTVEYLLNREGPLSTERLHPMVAEIHPDLCDDTVDRVIDGKRFGKKWKHAVRTAQQRLKSQGVIEHTGSVWRLIKPVGRS